MADDREKPGAGDRVVALLLRLHPESFRRRYADAVRETHALRSAEAWRRGRLAHAMFRIREYGGLALSAWRERRSERVAMSNERERNRGAERAGFRATVAGLVRESASAMRRLLRTPAFTAASVLMLALGIGASTAVYALIRGVVLKPLPYASPDRLLWLDHGAPGWGFDRGLGITVWQYLEYGESSRLLSGIALAQSRDVTLVEDATAPERLARAIVTPSLSSVMGVAPAIGRWFDDPSSRDVLVSHALWQRRWGGDPGLPGRTIQLSGTSYRVIGVMPKSFAFPEPGTDLWTVQEYTPGWNDGGFNFVGVGRMTEGATLPAVRAELQSLIGRAAEDFGENLQVARRVADGRIRATPELLTDHVTGSVRATLWMLFGAVLLVLLTAWANVANLFVARADARRREVAVRTAIGADRGAIARFFLAEGGLLAVSSWLVGAALAWVTVRAIAGFAPLDLPRADEIAIDAHVLLAALALALVASLGLTAIPLSRRDGASPLRDGGRATTAGRGRMRLRGGLMAIQVGLALMLLAASGLLVRSWMNVRSRSPGFQTREALFFEVALPGQTYPTRADAALFHNSVAERLEALAGVSAVAWGTCLPLDGFSWGEAVIPEGGSDADGLVVSLRRVSADFFDALQIPLDAGRTFGPTGGPPENAVVLSRATALRLFPGTDAVGRSLKVGNASADAPTYRVVGIAADVATNSVMEPRAELIVYLPIRDTYDDLVDLNRMSFIVRSDGDPTALAAAARDIVRDISPGTAVARVRTLSGVLAADRAQIALATVLLVLSAIVAVVLGASGIYAVFAYVVGRRTAEFGLRLALGAGAGHVLRIVFRQAGIVTAIGFVIGLAGAAVLTRSLASLLFGVSPLDATVFTSASLAILVIAFTAAFVPARRAWRLRPMEALRVD